MSEPRSDAARRCVRCSADLSVGRFCTNCGAPTDATRKQPVLADHLEPIELGEVVVMSTGQPRQVPAMRWLARWRAQIVLNLLVAALLVAGGVGARMLWARIPVPTTPPVTITCWDGEQRLRDDCTRPTGEECLRHVFPSFRSGQECTDLLRKRPSSTKPLAAPSSRAIARAMWRCRVRSDGEPVVVTYRELTSVRDGLSYHDEAYGDGARESITAGDKSPVRYVWRDPRGAGRDQVALTSMFVAFPYDVTVKAQTVRIRDRALRTHVEVRPVTDIEIRP